MKKGESALGFKAHAGAGGQGLQKWDKGIQRILAALLVTNAHPAALAIYEGELKTPTTEEEAKATARNIWALSSLFFISQDGLY
jgi:hypothetical protein